MTQISPAARQAVARRLTQPLPPSLQRPGVQRVQQAVQARRRRQQIAQQTQEAVATGIASAPTVSQTAAARSDSLSPNDATTARAAVSTQPADFTPASPQALRQIDARIRRVQLDQRIEPLRTTAATPLGIRAQETSLALDARQERLLREQQRDFRPVRQLDLIGTGIVQRGVQVGGVGADVVGAPVQTARRARAAAVRGAEAFRFRFQQRREQDGTLLAVGGIGGDVARAVVSPLDEAQRRPGVFLFDVGATAGALAAGRVGVRAIRGDPTGRPIGDVEIRLRERRTTISEVPQTPPPQAPPRITDPDIQLRFAESRGVFRTPAQTILNIRGDVIRRTQQLPDRTIVTAQRVGDPIAREITFRGAPGIRDRPRRVREVDPIQIQMPAPRTPQIIQQPEPIEILARGAAFRQERQFFTVLDPSPRTPLTLRGQFVLGQRVTAAPATLQDFQTVVFRRAGEQRIVTDALGQRIMTPDIRFTRGIFENPALIQTATREPVASLLPTRAGVLTQIEMRGQVLRSPPALQIRTERLRATGIMREVPLTERLAARLPTIRPLGRRAQLQLIQEPRVAVPIVEMPRVQLRIPSRVTRARSPLGQVAPLASVQFRDDLRGLGTQVQPFTAPTRIMQPAALIQPQQIARQQQQLIQRQQQITQLNLFAGAPSFTGLPTATFRSFPTPTIPFAPSLTLPVFGGGAPSRRQDVSFRVPRPRRTRTILQQFLTGARGTREEEITGLFLRN